MRRLWKTFATLTAVLALLSLPSPTIAQTGSQSEDDAELLLFTDYPSQVIGLDESPTIKLSLRSDAEP